MKILNRNHNHQKWPILVCSIYLFLYLFSIFTEKASNVLSLKAILPKLILVKNKNGLTKKKCTVYTRLIFSVEFLQKKAVPLAFFFTLQSETSILQIISLWTYHCNELTKIKTTKIWHKYWSSNGIGHEPFSYIAVK